jgi:S1-C subfamily serine protease
MKQISILFFSALACFISPFSFGAVAFKSSVVKIYVTIQREDYETPWQPEQPIFGSGSGFIIQKKRILTNAHVVSDARFIEIQREGDPRRYQALVLFIGHDCDLAVLTVTDPSFFDGTSPLPLGTGLPTLNDEVIALGYPIGGERISLTRGVVSRIDYIPYSHSGVDQHLAMQVDAAINPGNSGGPVLYKERVVGVAFQGIPNAQSLGYAIPLPVINHFLKDIEDACYDGYPELGAYAIDTRNPALRRSLKLSGQNEGAAVSRIDPYASSFGHIQPGDVLLSIDGCQISNDGNTVINGQTVDFNEVVEQKQCGESVQVQLLRNGEKKEITIPLAKRFDPYTYRFEYNRRPEYFICGGLVFTPLTMNYLAHISKDLNEPSRQHLVYYAQFVKTDGLYSNQNQYVVLSERLPHQVNTYDNKFLFKTVARVNGIPIRQMSDLPPAFAASSNNLHVIHFNEIVDTLVMDAREAQDADREIRSKYNIPAPYYLADEEQK